VLAWPQLGVSHVGGGGGEEITNGLGDICGCGSLFLSIFCPCVAYGQTRERAGLQACLPAAMTLLIPLLMAQLIRGLGVYFYRMHVELWLHTLQPDEGPAFFYLNLVLAQWMPTVVFAVLLAPNRKDLQKITGVAEGGCANYIMAGCFPCCVLAQEHRIIAQKWGANNEQPLSSGVVTPMAAVPNNTSYAQIQ
jgi:Cys-rich protein (TIGR01571 family)